MSAALLPPRRAEQLIADVEQRFTRVREEHPEFEGATAIVATPAVPTMRPLALRTGSFDVTIHRGV